MKLNNILLEDGHAVTFNHLTSDQVGVLKRIAAGQLSDETATPRQLAVMDSLRNLQLIDTFGELTPGGTRAAEMALKYPPKDRRDASRMDAAMGRTGGMPQRYTDTDDGTEVSDEPGRFQDRWGEVRDED